MPDDTGAPDPMADFISSESLDGEVVEKPSPKAPAPRPAAKATPEPDDGDDEGDDEGDAQPQPGDKHRSAQERINKAVGRQRAAERALTEKDQAIAALTARLEAIEKGLTPKDATPTVDTTKAPSPADFTYGELDPKYIAAVARFEAKQALSEAREADKKTQEERAQAAAREEAQTKLTQTIQRGLDKYDDFQDIVDAANRQEWPLSQIVGELMIESPFGHDIAYKLGSDPDLARKVNAMSPAQQAVWFGKQEAVFEAQNPPSPSADDAPAPKPAAARSVTQAPAPLQHRARGRAGNEVFTADTADFAKFEQMVSASQNRR